MNLKTQKRIAAQTMKVGQNRVWFDPNRLEEIKEAITKIDIRSLIKDRAIQAKPEQGISSYRSKKRTLQKRKGRRTGKGSRKGVRTARLPKKKEWMGRIRALRKMLMSLRDKNMIKTQTYNALRRKSKGGYFRSRRHLQLYLEGNSLLTKEKPKENIKKENDNTLQKKERRKDKLQ